MNARPAVGIVQPIAAIRGADSRDIQALIRAFIDALPEATRVAGVLEERPSAPGEAVCDPHLRNLRNGCLYPLFQDLGPCSTACGLDGESVVAVCEAVTRDIAEGCDLVVLNKFARLESERSGLTAAFVAAMEAGTPILTSVSPRFDEAWRLFAEPCFVMLPADPAAISTWWSAVSGTARA